MLPPSSPTGTCRADANAAAGMNPLPDNVSGNTVRWIIDSGATHHITYCESMLSECRKLSKSSCNKVQVPTRNKIHVKHFLTCNSPKSLHLLHVLHEFYFLLAP